jgi:hypothetical protein
VNASGQVAFRADVSKGNDSWTGIYLYDSGKIKPLVTTATDAPGGGTFTQAIDPRINNNGQVAFMGGTDAGMGVYLYDLASGQIKPLATPGMDLPGGGKVDGTSNSECALAINQSGAVAMLLMVDDGSMGVYSYHDGQLDVVAHAGMDLGVGTFDTADHCVAIGNQAGPFSSARIGPKEPAPRPGERRNSGPPQRYSGAPRGAGARGRHCAPPPIAGGCSRSEPWNGPHRR